MMSLFVTSSFAPGATLSEESRLTDAWLPDGWPLDTPGELSRIFTLPPFTSRRFVWTRLTSSAPAPALRSTTLAGWRFDKVKVWAAVAVQTWVSFARASGALMVWAALVLVRL